VNARGGVEPAVCLAASPGGHLAELRAAAGAFHSWRRTWVTGASSQADELRDAGEDVRLLPGWGRDPPGMRGLVPNLRAAARALRASRPRLVVTTGAGLVVPFALMARASGSHLAFVESMARVVGASLTGRLLAPFAGTVIVQWPEMEAVFRRARVCRPALLEPGPAREAAPGNGTFVSVGTRPEPFDRLLEMVDRSVADGVLPPPVVAQSGSSAYRPSSYRATPWLASGELARSLDGARYIVCHGGAAMVSAAIAAGRRPLVLARRRAGGEHRTEHQEQLVERLAAVGAVVALREASTEEELHAADEPRPVAGFDEGLPSVETALREEAEALSGGASGLGFAP
jgi:UDP-N-acetylglucosamine--N-acetylmuramyl-(pentapeptide) pyrophosphoryl-undecaprenol N-acetylglucosamine transferase